jgi:hypothetical protein
VKYGAETAQNIANDNGTVIHPNEESKTFSMVFLAVDYFPAGNITIPVQWTMRAQ